VRSPSADVFEKVELLLKTNQFESFVHTLIVFILINWGCLTNSTFFFFFFFATSQLD
jgi:hypothetical protein